MSTPSPPQRMLLPQVESSPGQQTGTQTPTPVVVVAKQASDGAQSPTVVQRGLDSHFVYRVSADKVEVVPVQVAYQNSAINIIKGVQAGDVLVSDGQSRLKAGAQVEVLKEPPQVIHTADAQVQP